MHHRYKLMLLTLTALCGFFTPYAIADDDKEMCHWSPHGGKVTLTVDPCPGTDNPSFYYAYYTQEDGVKGGGCWIGDSSVVLIVWEHHPIAYYPSSGFGSCDPTKNLKAEDYV
jgi:hypothetical protein